MATQETIERGQALKSASAAAGSSRETRANALYQRRRDIDRKHQEMRDAEALKEVWE